MYKGCCGEVVCRLVPQQIATCGVVTRTVSWLAAVHPGDDTEMVAVPAAFAVMVL